MATEASRRRPQKAAKREVKVEKDEDGPRRVALACSHCRMRKTKCDGGQPACSNCVTDGRPCLYTRVTAEENALARAKKQSSRLAKAAKKGFVDVTTMKRSSSAASLPTKLADVSLDHSFDGLGTGLSTPVGHVRQPQTISSRKGHSFQRELRLSIPVTLPRHSDQSLALDRCSCAEDGKAHHCHSFLPIPYEQDRPEHEGNHRWDHLPTPPADTPSPTFTSNGPSWSSTMQAPPSFPQGSFSRPPLIHMHSMPVVASHNHYHSHVHAHTHAYPPVLGPPLASPLLAAFTMQHRHFHPHYQSEATSPATASDFHSPYTSDFETQSQFEAGDYFENGYYYGRAATSSYGEDSSGCISPAQLLSPPASSNAHSRSVSAISQPEHNLQTYEYYETAEEYRYAASEAQAYVAQGYGYTS